MIPTNPKLPPRAAPRHQRGAATLVVVMILFFIMAMMAAYANRNLIFEQRIASNYYRGGLAFEAADAGIEWTLAQLNGVNIDDSCVTPGAGPTFRQRYLSLNASTRAVSTVLPSGSYSNPSAACVRMATAGLGWACECPGTPPWTPPTTPIVSSTQMQPSFQVGLVQSTIPGLLTINSLGCTGSNPSVCAQGNEGAANAALLGASHVKVNTALLSALKSPPSAPLTVRGSVTDGAARVGLHNTDALGNGLLLVAGGNVPAGTLADARLFSLPGTPGSQTQVTNETSLANANVTPGGMFGRFFGMSPSQYHNQPAVRTAATCSATTSACVDANLNTTLATGARMIWANGTLTLSGNGTFGTAANPVVIIANGAVTIDGSVTINGLLYAAGDITTNASQVRINGAVISEGNFAATSGLVDINYQALIVNTISNGMGSFVKVPGTWWEE